MKLLRKNVDRRGCALLTAYNAGQWSGMNIPYQHVSDTARAWCGFREQGLPTQKMSHLFISLNLPTKRVRKGTPLHKVISALFSGNAVAFAYTEVGGSGGHAVLVTPSFKIVNPESKYKKWNDLFLAICENKVTYNAWIVGKNDVS